jgi:hypothetical protein
LLDLVFVALVAQIQLLDFLSHFARHSLKNGNRVFGESQRSPTTKNAPKASSESRRIG